MKKVLHFDAPREKYQCDAVIVWLMLHSDCGAYGGLDGGFGGDARLEAQHHEEELRLAAEWLRKAIPGLEVQAYFVDFEGIWAVELARELAGSAANQ